MNFQIAFGGTALFYIGLFGAIYAISSGLIPPEHTVYDPVSLISRIIRDIHYFPLEWRGALHTHKVKNEFSKLFNMRITLLGYEMLSLFYLPVYMWIIVPRYIERIFDFVEQSTELTNDGYFCSFATFDFEKHGNVEVLV
jgi:autophagy-related protein 9